MLAALAATAAVAAAAAAATAASMAAVTAASAAWFIRQLRGIVVVGGGGREKVSLTQRSNSMGRTAWWTHP